MNNLRVTLVQSHLHWENPQANRDHFQSIITNQKDNSDLILLPEMFTTGFSMNAAQNYETMQGATVNWLSTNAKELKLAIAGSLIVKEGQNYYNRLVFATPDGQLQHYDKRHCFTLAGEHETYTAGKERLIVHYLGWKICPLICYDLRFPVWARNTVEYDLLLYLANWPKARVMAWDALLKARAIENMAYCIGVNRVGLDGSGYEYTGHSACYDLLGVRQSTAHFETEFVETINLSKQHIERTRNKLKFLADRDPFNLEV